MKPNWKDIAVEATRGTRTGAILLCALDRNEPGVVPRFEGKASITSDGFITCNFVDRFNQWHLGAFVGASEEWCANVRGLAHHLGLDADERAELFNVMRGWIGVDYRPEHSRGTL